jgi:hypothetical protein
MAWRARWWLADGLPVERIARKFGCLPGTVEQLLGTAHVITWSDPSPSDPAGPGWRAQIGSAAGTADRISRPKEATR